MPFARLAPTVRLAATASLFATLTLACWAQERTRGSHSAECDRTAQHVPALNYSKPVSHFPNPIGPYLAKTVARAESRQYRAH